MSSVPQYHPRYTIADYQTWQGDWELWDGIAIAMSPSPFGRHAQLLARLSKVLGNAIDESACKANVLVEID